MPEEDDDALGQMLGDRIKGTKDDAEDEERKTEDPSSEAETESASSSDTSEAASPDNTESTQITQSTDVSLDDDENRDETESETEEGTVRSRSPFPLYVTPGLKETVQNRFEKFNAQRTLNDEAQVEKHKHFMEGLLRAGLDHPELEEYVLNEFEDD